MHGACRIARDCGYDWIWIDTCCIDKTSSSELTEAINSMFNYYSGAGLCIAYLGDVVSKSLPGRSNQTAFDVESFRRSVWFSRGWTLQELLAPIHVDFFDRDFRFMGSKGDLCDIISERTGIARKYLRGLRRIAEASVVTRMSWASDRHTTRLEDRAYSLLGIFGVNMPLLYGEGKKAYFRLQQEILANSNDESLFAWIDEYAEKDQEHGMLAESPDYFRHSQSVRAIEVVRAAKPPIAWTSRGMAFAGYLQDKG